MLELHELSLKFAQEAEHLYGVLGEISVDYVIDEEEKLWMIELNDFLLHRYDFILQPSHGTKKGSHGLPPYSHILHAFPTASLESA